MAKSIGVCEHCGCHFEYMLLHNGFNDSAYAYCDSCGSTAVISGWSPRAQSVRLRVHQCIERKIENYLRRCDCGGKFTAGASPRCPSCKDKLSSSAAKTWIEANAPGTARGWHWQETWTGLYCIIPEGCVARDPWKPEFEADDNAMTLFRPVGPEELKLIEQAEFRAFPPRLPEQPIFYPVLTEEYAVKIAGDWNVKASGVGYVTRFRVRLDFLRRYEVHDAGGRRFQEYWIPAEDIAEFNQNIVGAIEIIRQFPERD